jgi:WD40 repeat protein
MSFMTKINNEENFVKNKIRNLLLKLPANSEWFNFDNLKKFESDFFVVITTPRHPITKNHIENIVDFSGIKNVILFIVPAKDEKIDRKLAETIISKFGFEFPVCVDNEKEVIEIFDVKKFPSIILETTLENKTQDSIKPEKIEGYEEIFNQILKKEIKKRNEDFYIDDTMEQKGKEQKEKLKSEIFGFDYDDELYKILAYRKYVERAKEIGEVDFCFPTKIACLKKPKFIAISNSGKREIIVLTWRFFELVEVIRKEYYNTEIKFPEGLDFISNDKELILLAVCDFGDNDVKIFNLWERKLVGKISIPFPKSIRTLGKNILLVASLTNKIYKVKLNENEIKKEIIELGDGSSLISDLTVKDGKIIFVDSYDSSIKELDLSSGEKIINRLAGGKGEAHKDGPAENSLLFSPNSLEEYRDTIFISDFFNNSIRVLCEKRLSTMILQNTNLSYPECLRIMMGSILVADTGNNRVIEIEPLSLTAEDIKIQRET